MTLALALYLGNAPGLDCADVVLGGKDPTGRLVRASSKLLLDDD